MSLAQHDSFLINLLNLHRGYSSVVEHSTADRRAPSSNLGAPFKISYYDNV